MPKPLIYAVIILAMLTAHTVFAANKTYHFDPEASSVVIDVPRAGFLSVLGHDHKIVAEIVRGQLVLDAERKEPHDLAVEIPVASFQLRDEEIGEGTSDKIDSKMRSGEVLDESGHPLIRFTGKTLSAVSGKQWKVEGELEIRGVRRTIQFPAMVKVSENQRRLQADGSLSLKPENFGIEPVKALAGAVRTASTIQLKFKVIAIASPD